MHISRVQRNTLVEYNRLLSGRLLTWDLLLFQLADSNQAADGRLLRILRYVYQLLEQDLNRGFVIEEQELYANIAERSPELHGLVGELCHEHAAMREQLQWIGEELDNSHGSGTVDRIRMLGMEFAQALREHMQREEEELIPASTEEWQHQLPSGAFLAAHELRVGKG
jgi:iron-sulfur cluster repair protein YtfE (RIC family)